MERRLWTREELILALSVYFNFAACAPYTLVII